MKSILDRYYIYEITSDDKKYYTLALSEEGAKTIFLGNIDSVKLYSPVPVNIDDDEFRLYHNYNIYEVKFSYDYIRERDCIINGTTNDMIYIATDDMNTINITNNINKFINKYNEFKLKNDSSIKSIKFEKLNIKSIKLILSDVKGFYRHYIDYNVENNINDYIYHDIYKSSYYIEVDFPGYRKFKDIEYIIIDDVINIEPYINSEYKILYNKSLCKIEDIKFDSIEYVDKVLCRKDNLNANKTFKIICDLNIYDYGINIVNGVEYVLADDSESAISIFKNFYKFKYHNKANILIKQIDFSVYNNVIVAV